MRPRYQRRISHGNTDSAELLRAYADDPLLGGSAIIAIKLLGGP
jgi:hypothetical protein